MVVVVEAMKKHLTRQCLITLLQQIYIGFILYFRIVFNWRVDSCLVYLTVGVIFQVQSDQMVCKCVEQMEQIVAEQEL